MIQLDERRLRQIQYIGIKEEDLELLASMKEHFENVADEVVDSLYERIIQEPRLKAIIEEHSSLDRLKTTQRWYYVSMTDGVIDHTYIETRLRIGAIHSRIGLTTDWYLGTYMMYLDAATYHLKRIIPDRWIEVTHALSKMFNLDSQLVLEAYEAGEQQKVQDIADRQAAILAAVNQAVQELAAMMSELTGSTQSIAETAGSTAEAQDESLQLMNELYEEVREIGEMGAMMREISDQTHLLGLNAAIEAAHAAEFGRGFEVVANEIRKLASNSKQSLESVQKKLKAINERLHQVQEGMGKTSEYAKHQAAASQELASFVAMIEKVTEQLELAANG